MILQIVFNDSVKYYDAGNGNYVPYIMENVSNISQYLHMHPNLILTTYQDFYWLSGALFILGMITMYAYNHYEERITGWMLGLFR